MRGLGILLLKEERAVFSSPIAYVLVSVFVLLMGYTFTVTLFLNKVATLVHMFFQMSVLFLLMVPAITMRLLAEERKTGTIELLLTAPVIEIQIVLAKFLASMTLILVMLTLSASYAVVLGIYGEPDWGPIHSGYLGLVLQGSALVALGLLASSLTGNQIVAAMLSLGLFLLLWMLDTFGYLLPVPFDTFFVNLAMVTHFTPFATGSLFLSDAGYFVSLTLLGLFLSVRALARR
jgi:ABC-2 type transport system permease protein